MSNKEKVTNEEKVLECLKESTLRFSEIQKETEIKTDSTLSRILNKLIDEGKIFKSADKDYGLIQGGEKVETRAEKIKATIASDIKPIEEWNITKVWNILKKKKKSLEELKNDTGIEYDKLNRIIFLLEQEESIEFKDGKYGKLKREMNMGEIQLRDLRKIQGKDRNNREGFEFFSTGIESLDAMLGGGFKVGGVTELAGWSNVGKSTLLLKSIANIQKNGIKVYYVDSEETTDVERAASLGVLVKDIKIEYDSIIQHIFQKFHDALEKGYRFLVLDSMGSAMPYESSTDTEEGAGADYNREQMGLRAMLYGQVMRKLNPLLNKHKATLVVVNQYYQPMGGQKGDHITKGGKAKDYVFTQRLEVVGANGTKKQLSSKTGNNILKAQRVTIRLVKTKVLTPINFGEIDLVISYKNGEIRQFDGFIDMLLAWDLVRREANTYYYLGYKVGTIAKLGEFIINNYDEVRESLVERSTNLDYKRESEKEDLEILF